MDPAKDAAKQLATDKPKQLTRYERTHVVGVRAEQLARGAQPFVDAPVEANVYEVAEQELAEGVLPFVVVRNLPNGKTEQLRIGANAMQ